jgi:hypothetical protein
LDSHSAISTKNYSKLLIPGIVSLLFVGLIAFLYLFIQHRQGHFTYCLDDAYIHMAMAKTMLQNGVYGVTPYAFGSASSSIIWQFLLIFFYAIFGINEWIPLVINTGLAVMSIYLLYRFNWQRWPKAHIQPFIFLIGMALLSSYPKQIFDGMEHMLQIVFSMLYVFVATQYLTRPKSSGPNFLLSGLLLLTPLLCIIRYENLFIVGVIVLFLLGKREIGKAALLLLLAILPLFIFGWFLTAHGDHILPNSVLLKGNLPEFTNLRAMIKYFSGYFAYRKLLQQDYLIVLIIGVLVTLVYRLRQKKTLWEPDILMAIIFLVITPLQAQFGSITGRYSAYLVHLGLWVTLPLAFEFTTTTWKSLKTAITMRKIPEIARALVLFVLLLFVSLPVLDRAGFFIGMIPRATKNIYEQQYQMGLFVKKHFNQASIALNDLGAVAFLSESRILDLFGLSDATIYQLKKEGQYNKKTITQLALDYRSEIAIVYDTNFSFNGMISTVPQEIPNGLPDIWRKVGRWTIQNNYACGNVTVSFYACNSDSEKKLRDSFTRFSQQLSDRILVDSFPLE